MLSRAQEVLDQDHPEEAFALLHSAPLRKVNGPQKRQREILLADINFYRGEVNREKRDFAAALINYQAALKIDAIYRPYSAGVDANTIGLIYNNLNQPKSALRSFNQSLKIRRKIKDRAGEAVALTNIGTTYNRQGQREEALTYFLQALPIRKEVKDRGGEGITLGNIGAVYSGLGHRDKALEYYLLALPLRREAKDRLGEAVTLSNIGNLYDSIGQHEKALDYFGQAVVIRREVKDKAGEAITLSNIGAAYDNMGERGKALDYFQQSLVLERELEDKVNESITLSNIGLTYDHVGEREKALDYYQQSLAVGIKSENKIGVAGTLTNIGSVYYNLGKNEEALTPFQQALVMWQIQKDRSGEAVVLSNIGAVYNRMGNKGEALRYFKLALPVHQSVGDREGEAATIDNIGLTYSSLGSHNLALRYFQQALAIERELASKVGEATALSNVGLAYDNLGQPDRALLYYQQALPLYRRVENREGEAITLNNLMGNKANPSLAIFYGKQAVNLFQGLRANIAGLDQNTQRSYLNQYETTYRSLIDLLIQHGRLVEAEQVTRLLKEEEYFSYVRGGNLTDYVEQASMTAQERQYVHRYSEIQDKIIAISLRLEELKHKKKSDLSTAETNELELLRTDQVVAQKQFDAFLKALNDAFKSLGSTVVKEVNDARSWQTDLTNIKDQGGENVAILQVLEAPEHFSVVLITPEARVAFSASIPSKQLDEKVFAFRAALKNSTSNPLLLAQELYNIVFFDGKLDRALHDAKIDNALWLLDGSLRYLPIIALHNGQHYLVEDSLCHSVVTSATHKKLGQIKTADKIIAAGVSKEHTVEFLNEKNVTCKIKFDPLWNVIDELRGIVSDPQLHSTGLMAGSLLLDENFTLISLTQALDEGNINVHIASHFNLEPGSEKQSFLLMGDGQIFSMEDWHSQLDLRRVDLLTLSACETDIDVGETWQGIPVESLAETSQQMGAMSVVASLWAVGDGSTSHLMEQFYRLQMSDQNHPKLARAQALKMAALATMNYRDQTGAHPYKHPYFWAPFTLTGNWR